MKKQGSQDVARLYSQSMIKRIHAASFTFLFSLFHLTYITIPKSYINERTIKQNSSIPSKGVSSLMTENISYG